METKPALEKSNTNELNSKKKYITLDENLIKLIAQGDMKAFEELYNKTDKAVFGFIFSILRNKANAEDVMQDTYLKIIPASKIYNPQGKPISWILTIAKNLALMSLRSEKKTNTSIDDLENNIEFSQKDETEDKLILNLAISKLADDEKQIVILHSSGVKHREIASFLNMPLSTVLSKYNRALKKLKKILEGD
ncbi:MAG: RNA polymerase sigma factor [Oscillospiraceae bacterium]